MPKNWVRALQLTTTLFQVLIVPQKERKGQGGMTEQELEQKDVSMSVQVIKFYNLMAC